jgi:cell wall-associated NlpC family hydrolase
MKRLIFAACLLGLAAFSPAAAVRKKAPAFSRADAEQRSLFLGQAVVKGARRQLGKPYVWGGSDPQVGFDCAGFTRYVCGQAGVKLPQRAIDQFMAGLGVERQALLPGDLVFFTSSSPQASMHVGIYEGQGVFIHAPHSGGHIQRSRLDSGYFAARYLGARRMSPDTEISGQGTDLTGTVKPALR